MKRPHPVVVFTQWRKDGSPKNLANVQCLKCRWKITGIDDNIPFAEWLASQHGIEVAFDER
jgi:hypothetical protein